MRSISQILLLASQNVRAEVTVYITRAMTLADGNSQLILVSPPSPPPSGRFLRHAVSS